MAVADGTPGGRQPPAADSGREPTIAERVDHQPAFDASKVREVSPRDLVVRFAAGALTSVVAGIVTLAWGPKAGGVLLAFPAILAASLTLIEEEEDAVDAREDSRGAVAGGLALVAFALVAAVLFARLAAGWALLCAAAAWVLVALAIYRLAWYRRR